MANTDMAIFEEMQGAFRRSAAARADRYRIVRDHISGVSERNADFSRSFYRDAVSAMERQYEGNRALAGELTEQTTRQREALQEITIQSISAWTRFFDKSFEEHRYGLELVEETVGKAVEDSSEIAGKMHEIVQDAVSDSDLFPIENYDDLNVEQVKTQLDGLSAAEIRMVSEYEKQHKNRETLVDQLSRRLKAKSA